MKPFKLQALNSLLHFLLYSRIYIALAVTGLCLETDLLINVIQLKSIWFYAYIFFATLFTYNFYYLNTNYFKHTKPFTVLSLIALLICFYFSKDELNWFILSISAMFSFMYLLPVYIKLHIFKNQTLPKLFLLIIVLCLVTLSLVVKKENWTDFLITFDPYQLLFYIYRIALITVLCTLFYIKDEIKEHNTKFTKMLLLVALGIMAGCSFYLLTFDSLGIVFLIGTFLSMLASYYSIFKLKSDKWHLFYVDGIMILQSIFALIYYWSFVK